MFRPLQVEVESRLHGEIRQYREYAGLRAPARKRFKFSLAATGREWHAVGMQRPIDLPEADLAEIMLKHPLFRLLNFEQQQALKPLISLHQRLADDILIAEGEPQDCLYVLIEGKLNILRRQPDNEALVTAVGPGALVGEHSALLGRPALAQVRLESDALLACLHVPTLREAFGSTSVWPALVEGMAGELAVKLEEVSGRAADGERWQQAQTRQSLRARRALYGMLALLALQSLLTGQLLGWLPGPASELGLTLLQGLTAAGVLRLLPAPLAPGRPRLLKLLPPVAQALSWSAVALVVLLSLRSWLPARPDWLNATAAAGPLLVLRCVSQEIQIRVGLQACLKSLTREQGTPWLALILTNLLWVALAAQVLPVGPSLLLGLCWSWLYDRQDSLAALLASRGVLALALWLAGTWLG